MGVRLKIMQQPFSVSVTEEMRRAGGPLSALPMATRSEGERRGPSLSGDTGRDARSPFAIQSATMVGSALRRCHKLGRSIPPSTFESGPIDSIAACRRAATCLMEQPAQSGDSRWRDKKKNSFWFWLIWQPWSSHANLFRSSRPITLNQLLRRLLLLLLFLSVQPRAVASCCLTSHLSQGSSMKATNFLDSSKENIQALTRWLFGKSSFAEFLSWNIAPPVFQPSQSPPTTAMIVCSTFNVLVVPHSSIHFHHLLLHLLLLLVISFSFRGVNFHKVRFIFRGRRGNRKNPSKM